ncbi:hypothetical protein B0H14DRAFT_3495846 [Mycena olivaceomarginata]|nr:hypothetical protein B0H14DRAFT_3495846 [Mycena olivaceomarginata]
MSRPPEPQVLAMFTDDLASIQPILPRNPNAEWSQFLDIHRHPKAHPNRATTIELQPDASSEFPSFGVALSTWYISTIWYPAVSIPSSWTRQTSYQMPGSQWNSEPPGYRHANGYSDAHALYGAHRKAWAKRAYQGNAVETIGVLMQVLRDVPGKAKGVIVLNLSEGKEIPANATPTFLIELILATMVPKLREATHGYNFDQSRFVIRDVSSWINLAEENPSSPWFYNKCLGAPNTKSKDKTPVFKRPRTSFIVALVLSVAEWDRYLDFAATIEEPEEPRHSHSSSDRVSQRTYGAKNKNDTLNKSKSNQRTHESKNKAPSLRPSTPPASRKRTFPEHVYISPDRTRLRKALALNGASDISQAHNVHTSERIEFYPLQPRPLHELLGHDETQSTRFFTCDPAHASQGSILVEFSTDIGIGTFKSAHTGHLILIHLPSQGLGTAPNELVAVKRMYRWRTQNTTTGNWVTTRFLPADEHAMIIQEANLLYWASSLMDFTYSFIHLFLSNADEEPPFTIPQLRFVHAGVAVSHDQVAGNNISNTSSIRRTYLVEEFIEESDGFVKFVHNGDANSLLDTDDPFYHIAEFLCFTQHVQYFKTDGTVFLSDLQGSDMLLTDPQIMTSPYEPFSPQQFF